MLTTTVPSPRLATIRAALILALALLIATAMTLVPSNASAQPANEPTTAGVLDVPLGDPTSTALPEHSAVVPEMAPDEIGGTYPVIDYRGNVWRQTAAKAWAFTQCIFGVGAPIGIAIGLATTPQFWSFVAGFSPLPTWTYGAMKYGNTVKSRCRWAIHG